MRQPVLASFVCLLLTTAAPALWPAAPAQGGVEAGTEERPAMHEAAAQSPPSDRAPVSAGAAAPEPAATAPTAASPGSPPAATAAAPTASDQKEPEDSHSQPHPLAAKHPGDDVIVCEAGCSGAEPEVVYRQPRARENVDGATTAVVSGVVPTAGKIDPADADRDASAAGAARPAATDAAPEAPVCVAGCPHLGPRADAAAFATAASAELDRLVQERPEEQPKKLAPPVRTIARSTSGEWLARIERERKLKP